MRAILAVSLAVAAIGFYAPQLSAEPAATAVQRDAVPITRVGWGWGGFYDGYRPACPWGYHYACRFGPYGYRHCACWRDYY